MWTRLGRALLRGSDPGWFHPTLHALWERERRVSIAVVLTASLILLIVATDFMAQTCTLTPLSRALLAASAILCFVAAVTLGLRVMYHLFQLARGRYDVIPAEEKDVSPHERRHFQALFVGLAYSATMALLAVYIAVQVYMLMWWNSAMWPFFCAASAGGGAGASQ